MKIFSRNFLKIIAKKFGGMKKTSYLCNAKAKRAFSSAGSEHLPYKQRVGGSNPSTPTKPEGILLPAFFAPRGQSVSGVPRKITGQRTEKVVKNGFKTA